VKIKVKNIIAKALLILSISSFVIMNNEILNIGMKIERDAEKTLKELVEEAKLIVDFLVVAEKKIYDETLQKLSLILPMPMTYGDFKEQV
jgi:hypothetical protein